MYSAWVQTPVNYKSKNFYQNLIKCPLSIWPLSNVQCNSINYYQLTFTLLLFTSSPIITNLMHLQTYQLQIVSFDLHYPKPLTKNYNVLYRNLRWLPLPFLTQNYHLFTCFHSEAIGLTFSTLIQKLIWYRKFVPGSNYVFHTTVWFLHHQASMF